MVVDPLHQHSATGNCKNPRCLWYKAGSQTDLNAMKPTHEAEDSRAGIRTVCNVFKFNCKYRPAIFIGETCKRLGNRLHEHECAISGQERCSQRWMPMLEANHQFNFIEANVIAQGGNGGIQL